MQIYQIDVEEKIVAVASSIEADAKSWKGWSVLHIESPDSDGFQDIVIATKAIAESYLKNVEGVVYLCRNRNIYIVCKGAPDSVLEQAGMQICAMAGEQGGQPGAWRVYSDMENHGYKFSESVFNRLTRPFDSSFGIDRLIGEAIDDIEHHREKKNKPIRVLLVEDDPVTRWIIGNTLQGECDFVAVDTASKVFSSYSSYNPDIVFLDIGLPDNSGNDVLEWIMRNDPAACVVMLSGRDSVDNISGCIESGARGFIPKPVLKDNLLHYIRRYG